MKSLDLQGKPFEIKFKGVIKMGIFSGLATYDMPFNAGSEKAIKELVEKTKEIVKANPKDFDGDVSVEYEEVK